MPRPASQPATVRGLRGAFRPQPVIDGQRPGLAAALPRPAVGEQHQRQAVGPAGNRDRQQRPASNPPIARASAGARTRAKRSAADAVTARRMPVPSAQQPSRFFSAAARSLIAAPGVREIVVELGQRDAGILLLVGAGQRHAELQQIVGRLGAFRIALVAFGEGARRLDDIGRARNRSRRASIARCRPSDPSDAVDEGLERRLGGRIVGLLQQPEGMIVLLGAEPLGSVRRRRADAGRRRRASSAGARAASRAGSACRRSASGRRRQWPAAPAPARRHQRPRHRRRRRRAAPVRRTRSACRIGRGRPGRAGGAPAAQPVPVRPAPG